MDPYQETFNTWNKIAGLYEEKFMDLDIYNASYDAFCELLNQTTPKVLELGCGPGNITRYVLAKKPEIILDACDVAPNMVALASKNNPGATVFELDVRNLSQLKKKYNAILCGFCVPYLAPNDCEQLLKDCRKLLVSEGLLYLSYVNGKQEASGFQTGSSGDRAYFYYHEKETLESILKQNSFHVVRNFEIVYSRKEGQVEVHSALIAKKTD